MAGMFQVYATLFHVTFDEVKGANTWADGVRLYEIHDAPHGKLLAKFYVDLFPRPASTATRRASRSDSPARSRTATRSRSARWS